jgi:hypothetical protein
VKLLIGVFPYFFSMEIAAFADIDPDASAPFKLVGSSLEPGAGGSAVGGFRRHRADWVRADRLQLLAVLRSTPRMRR